MRNLKAQHSEDPKDSDRRTQWATGSPLEQGPPAVLHHLLPLSHPGFRIIPLGQQGLCPLFGHEGLTGGVNLRLVLRVRRGLSSPLVQAGHLCPHSRATPRSPRSLTTSTGPAQSQVSQVQFIEILFLEWFWQADFLRTFVWVELCSPKKDILKS